MTQAPGARLDALLPGASHTPLCIGDTIALCVQRGKQLCFVGSEGFVELSASLRDDLDLSRTVPYTHLDCLWVVTQKHQYDAQKSMRRFQKAKQRATVLASETAMGKSAAAAGMVSPPGKVAPQSPKKKRGGVAELAKLAKAQEAQDKVRQEHEELASALRAERASNNARNDEKSGTPITYGETIQLMHAKSRKYLVLNAKRRSAALGCYSVRLEAEGSEDAWLAIAPRHAFQFEGAGVHNHDLFTLQSIKRQLWLHVGRTRARLLASSPPRLSPRFASRLSPLGSHFSPLA